MNDGLNQLRTLTEIVKDTVSHKESEDSKKLIYFIRRCLGQAGLLHEYSESEILISAYFRIREKIESGVIIENYLAYIKRFCQLIVIEESRRRNSRNRLTQKLMSFDNDQEATKEPAHSETYSEEVIENLWQAFYSLSEREMEILRLRIVVGLPWREIAILMVEQRKEFSTTKGLEAKLRKQGERAIHKLRHKLSSVDES